MKSSIITNFLNAYVQSKRIISVFNRNNCLVQFEDKLKNKWILKITNRQNVEQCFLSISIQNKLSLEGLSPLIVQNNKNQMYIENNDYIGFIQSYISSEDIHEGNINDILKSIDVLHSKLSELNYKSITKNEQMRKHIHNIILDKQFVDYQIVKTKFYEHYKKEFSSIGNLKQQRVHGDLRPENVIINNKQIYFIDFEYSRMGYAEVEKLKFFLLWTIGLEGNIERIYKNIYRTYSFETFILLAKEIIDNRYLENNWSRIEESYRKQIINEHMYLLTCIKDYFKEELK